MSRNALAALALAATTLAASGCGGSGSSASKPLTRSELIAKADAICKQANAKHASLVALPPTQIVSVTSQLGAYEYTVAGELSKLIPPASLKNDWDQIVASTRAMAGDFTGYSQYAKTSRLKAADGLYLPAIGEAEKKISETAATDGFEDCAHTS